MRLIQKALTFDDVMLLPACSDIVPANTCAPPRGLRLEAPASSLVQRAHVIDETARLAAKLADDL